MFEPTNDPQNPSTAGGVYRLGEEPRDDLGASTTAQERLRILRELTERAWDLTGRPWPDYARAEIPVRITRSE